MDSGWWGVTRFCLAKDTDTGILCCRAHGHHDEIDLSRDTHVGWDNTREWKGSPGVLVSWSTADRSDNDAALIESTTTQVEAGSLSRSRMQKIPTGELCHCGGLLVQMGACKICTSCADGGSCG